MMTNRMKGLIDFLDRDDWNYTVVSDTVIETGIKFTNGEYSLYFQEEGDKFIHGFAYLGIKIPEKKYVQIAEFVTRANYAINGTRFEFNYNNGKLRVAADILIPEEDIPDDVYYKTLAYLPGRWLDLYYNGITSVIFANKSPLDAINEIENS